MKEKKLKISEFIKSMEGDELNAATCLMGGAKGNSDGIMSTTNTGDCKNESSEACKDSTNTGACKNSLGACNDSTNGNGCNNAFKPVITPINPTDPIINGARCY